MITFNVNRTSNVNKDPNHKKIDGGTLAALNLKYVQLNYISEDACSQLRTRSARLHITPTFTLPSFSSFQKPLNLFCLSLKTSPKCNLNYPQPNLKVLSPLCTAQTPPPSSDHLFHTPSVIKRFCRPQS